MNLFRIFKKKYIVISYSREVESGYYTKDEIKDFPKVFVLGLNSEKKKEVEKNG